MLFLFLKAVMPLCVCCPVLEALNQLPREQHGTDIMRVRLHLLASQGQLYRQTIMTSSFTTPLLNAAFSKSCHSHAGKFRLLAQPAGVLAQVVPQVSLYGLCPMLVAANRWAACFYSSLMIFIGVSA